jgi:hypothetical protein
MTKAEIYNSLKEVFHEFDQTIKTSPFYSIIIHTHLEVFTYNKKTTTSSEAIWYFKNPLGNETRIPNENTKEFLEVYLEIFKQILEAHKLVEEIRKSLEPENLDKLVKSQIRNRKLEGLIPLNN